MFLPIFFPLRNSFLVYIYACEKSSVYYKANWKSLNRSCSAKMIEETLQNSMLREPIEIKVVHKDIYK